MSSLSESISEAADPSSSAPAAARPAPALLLRFAHVSLSASLRHDYFSAGQGHQQSKAVVSGRSARVQRSRLKAAKQPLVQPDEATEEAEAPPALDEPTPASDASWEQAVAQTGDRYSSAGADLAARYLADVAACPRLNSSEEYHLANLACEGDLPSRQRLIEHHLGLVVMMAKRHVNRGLPLLDLIEEGNIGLITASSKFDPELGYRFSTYAKWWIRQSIDLAVMTQSRLVRLPIHMSRSAKQAARLQRESQRDGNGNGNGSAAAGNSRDAADVNLEALLDDDDRDSKQLIDEIADDDGASPEAHASRGERRDQLRRMLDALSHKERRVIEARFGVRHPEPRTLEHIARELKLSCERVRQIETQALQRLRELFAENGLEVDCLL